MKGLSVQQAARTAAACAALALSPILVSFIVPRGDAPARSHLLPEPPPPMGRPAPDAATMPATVKAQTPPPAAPPARQRTASETETPASRAWVGHVGKTLARLPRVEGMSDRLATLRPIPSPDCSRQTYGGASTVALDEPRSAFLSTAWVGDREGPETSVVVLTVPDGAPRFHVVVTEPTSPVVYDLRGNVGAILDLAVLSRPGPVAVRVGIAGLPPSRVAFVESGACPDPAVVHRDTGAALGAGLTRGYDLHGIDVVSPEASTSIPSGLSGPDPARQAAEGRFAGGTLATGARTAFPNGIVEVDPGSIVSTAPSGRYGILPREAGLAEGAPFGITPEPETPGTFRISTETTLPSAMCGTHAARLDVDTGVSRPAGDPCDSCFVRHGAPTTHECEPAR